MAYTTLTMPAPGETPTNPDAQRAARAQAFRTAAEQKTMPHGDIVRLNPGARTSGFDFTTTHAISILYTSVPRPHGNIDQTTFALREDDLIVRAHRVRDDMGISWITRELDGEESDAIVDLATNRDNNPSKRSAALRLTEAERKEVQERVSGARETHEKLRQKVRSLYDMHGRSQEADDVFFG